MTYEAHPVDTLLRDMAGDPSPSYADVLKGRRALAAVIAADANAPTFVEPRRERLSLPSGWLRHVSAAAMAMAVLVATIAIAGLLTAEPVTALGELAQVAERSEQVTLSQGEFTYTRAAEMSATTVRGADIGLPDRAEVIYFLTVTRERWEAADGTILERSLVGQPEFLDDEAEAAYLSSGLAAQDMVGELVESEYVNFTSILDQRVWPTEANALLEAMRSTVSNEGNPVAESASLVELAAALLRETGAAPELRSAVLQVLDGLGLEVVERDNGNIVTVGIEYVDSDVLRLELQFDAGANLVAERLTWVNDVPALGVPAGTSIHQSNLSPSRTVSSVDSP